MGGFNIPKFSAGDQFGWELGGYEIAWSYKKFWDFLNYLFHERRLNKVPIIITCALVKEALYFGGNGGNRGFGQNSYEMGVSKRGIFEPWKLVEPWVLGLTRSNLRLGVYFTFFEKYYLAQRKS